MHGDSKVYVFNKKGYTYYKQLFYRNDTLFSLNKYDEEYWVSNPSQTMYNPGGRVLDEKVTVPAGTFTALRSGASFTTGYTMSTYFVYISPGIGPIKTQSESINPDTTIEDTMELIKYEIH